MRPYAETIQRVQAVLFDAGNTLLHVDYPFIASLPACRSAGIGEDQLMRAEVEARIAAGAAYQRGVKDTDVGFVYFETMLRVARVDPTLIAEMNAILQERNRTHGLWCHVIPGTRDAIVEIRSRGFGVGVISNSDGRVEQQLAACGLADCFGFILDSHHVGMQKPDPRIFRLGVDRLRLPPHAVAYVGDLPDVDVAGAIAAGLVPVLIDPLDAFSNLPVLRIHNVTELPGLLPSKPTGVT